MALVGGGGSPNVAGGANPAGVGSGLNYVGEFCYAYSGMKATSTSFQDYLRFTTGSEAIVAEIHVTGDWDSLGGNNVETQVSLNSEAIILEDTSAELAPYVWPIKVIIPPFTEFKVEMIVQTGTPEYSCLFTGRIYA